MKTAVIADVHANLPALRAALAAIRQEGCDRIVHLGDAIGIGPQPAECLELLCGLQGATLIMGNHDAYFAHGIPDPRPAWMGEGELRHQRWIHTQLDERLAVRHRSVPYDDATLARDFERREVPERSFIDRAFFGGRLGLSIRDGATS